MEILELWKQGSNTLPQSGHSPSSLDAEHAIIGTTLAKQHSVQVSSEQTPKAILVDPNLKILPRHRPAKLSNRDPEVLLD